MAATLFAAALPSSGRAATPPIGIVFFTEWSALLDDAAKDVIKHSAEIATSTAKAAALTVTGYADTTGSGEANDLLSATRAQVVIDQLVADGVPSARITRAAKGATPDIGGTNESRRVMITAN